MRNIPMMPNAKFPAKRMTFSVRRIRKDLRGREMGWQHGQCDGEQAPCSIVRPLPILRESGSLLQELNLLILKLYSIGSGEIAELFLKLLPVVHFTGWNKIIPACLKLPSFYCPPT